MTKVHYVTKAEIAKLAEGYTHPCVIDTCDATVYGDELLCSYHEEGLPEHILNPYIRGKATKGADYITTVDLAMAWWARQDTQQPGLSNTTKRRKPVQPEQLTLDF